MARKRRSVKPATFALAMSILGPAWATRLESPKDADKARCKRNLFKPASRCGSAQGVFATILCLIGVSSF
ncbi:MAG: hypothetical protein QF666_08670 [Alphaproteobacteria bacterium]|jgi:hypothetical protein|nr:hypothetical protein [Alphaproteobacteria bacterium]|tara:strand:+ start:2250 stop:2459 length:210 start_codon:yes stop_codon:yes gene_type:complete